MLPFTPEELAEAVVDGRVTKRPHPTLPLFIYNYSPDVQYSNRWDRITRTCRGLILNEDGDVVARPWEKFFNLGQVDLPIQFDTPVEVMDKVDGSLGILYPTPEGNAIATRGSFASEQAIHATVVLREKYPTIARNIFDVVNAGWTYLFEIVYPENRIVLDYGDQDDLVLLGAVQNDGGYYVGPSTAAAMLVWTGPVVEVMPFNTISDALGEMARKNAEGYVIRAHNWLVKLKQPDYLDLHRLVTNASPRTVWEKLRDGMSKSEIVSAFPDEFHDYIASMVDPLLDAYEKRYQEILADYSRTLAYIQDTYGFEATRKRYAVEFALRKDRKYMFLLLDSKPIRDVLWVELKPNITKENNGTN